MASSIFDDEVPSEPSRTGVASFDSTRAAESAASAATSSAAAAPPALATVALLGRTGDAPERKAHQQQQEEEEEALPRLPLQASASGDGGGDGRVARNGDVHTHRVIAARRPGRRCDNDNDDDDEISFVPRGAAGGRAAGVALHRAERSTSVTAAAAAIAQVRAAIAQDRAEQQQVTAAAAAVVGGRPGDGGDRGRAARQAAARRKPGGAVGGFGAMSLEAQVAHALFTGVMEDILDDADASTPDAIAAERAAWEARRRAFSERHGS